MFKKVFSSVCMLLLSSATATQIEATELGGPDIQELLEDESSMEIGSAGEAELAKMFPKKSCSGSFIKGATPWKSTPSNFSSTTVGIALKISGPYIDDFKIIEAYDGKTQWADDGVGFDTVPEDSDYMSWISPTLDPLGGVTIYSGKGKATDGQVVPFGMRVCDINGKCSPKMQAPRSLFHKWGLKTFKMDGCVLGAFAGVEADDHLSRTCPLFLCVSMYNGNCDGSVSPLIAKVI